MTKWTLHIIAFVLIAVAAICFAFWYSGLEGLSDFGLNAFTEVIGIAFTVFLIDLLLKRRDEIRRLPQRAACYQDVQLLTSRVLGFWTEACRLSVPGLPPATIDKLFSEEVIEKIGKLLDLDSPANVTPKRNWWIYLVETLSDHKKRAERILERHNNILDPNAYLAISKIDRSLINIETIMGMRQSDQQNNFPSLPVMGNYFFVHQEYRTSVLQLIEWCGKEFSSLTKAGIESLNKVSLTVPPWPATDTPSCMTKPEKIKEYDNKLREFRKSGKTLE